MKAGEDGGNTKMRLKSRLLGASILAAVGATALSAGAAMAQEAPASRQQMVVLDIPAGPASTGLNTLATQADVQIFYPFGLVSGRTLPAIKGEYSRDEAIRMVADAAGLNVKRQGDAYALEAPQSGSANDGADGTVDTLVVTAQKREEDIQDVPIAISAFTQEQLTDRQVAGGPDLMTQVPNFTFTKTNFSSYSIQLRGIGTQAISATTDPAVAVAFNNTPFVRNRFFEQEFYDLQRVEVLRGPQGTLYGRNATAGVVNIISAKPSFQYEARLSGDVANYNSTRLEGMINIPLVEDAVSFRLAGAWTKRDGYATNEITGNPIDGRDLWSTRASLRVAPTDRLDVNLIWEHFEEDDDRLRSGKQLCHTHVPTEIAGLSEVNGVPVSDNPGLPNTGQGSSGWSGAQGTFSQGCAPTSLYAPESFQTPNGFALPYYLPLGAVFLPVALTDPYVSRSQSHDLRVIESTVDPEYRARTDLVELQFSYDLSDNLTLTSETAWATDFIFSTQDFNRFNTAPGAWRSTNISRPGVITPGPNGGIFCDPQIGCADRLVAVDLSTAQSDHFSQEFRLGSNFEGPFNFSLGGNFLRYDTEEKYYVFINSLTIIAALSPFGSVRPLPPYVGGVTDNKECLRKGSVAPDPNTQQDLLYCTYIDPNPINNLNDLGHNYFLSKNPYKLISYALFGEAYYNVAENLKITAGLRWTVDKKEAPRIPSWLLASDTIGYPVMEVLEQEWREPTGRLTVDWKPDLVFTDETMIYGSYARGYKAGGANPPPYGIALYGSRELVNIFRQKSFTNPKTFDAEFVDAFELGAKNTLLDGRLTLNTAAFYYDYRDYQISQIVDRSASNLNFDAEVWGLEIEADWRPLENLKLGIKLGYEDTQVADGEKAIDLMDRTAGTPGWVVVRPFPSIPSNCVLPEWLFLGNTSSPGNPELVNLGGAAGGNPGGCEAAYAFGVDPGKSSPGFSSGAGKDSAIINYTAFSTDPAMFPGWPAGQPITDRTYPGWDPTVDYGNNNGEGFFKDLSGNELPNAPHYTATVTVDYTVPLPNDWLATLHTDLYYQSEAWTRIFNTEGYDKLKAYTNVNLAAIFTNEDAGWKVMAYVKNVFDRDSITGAFLNSDDTGLTTNVFLTEPRLYGLRVTKDWRGGSPFGSFGARSEGPFPLTVELGGQLQRHEFANEPLRPSFAGSFAAGGVDNFTDAQDDDFDWGDGREVKLTWRPDNGPWNVSAGFRYGKANDGVERFHTEAQTDPSCAFTGKYAFLCGYYPQYVVSKTNHSDLAHWKREKHQIIDFAVGRDFGLGGLSRSSVSVGLRHARFESDTEIEMDAIPDWVMPEGWFIPGATVTHTRYEATLDAEREFEGTGPVLSWDGGARLLGNRDNGYVDLDWALSGGVLFGKHTAAFAGSGEMNRYINSLAQDGFLVVPYGVWTTPDLTAPTVEFNASRSDSVTVPTAAVSLGLSYSIDRVSVGAGYRWERYYDAIDGGYREPRDAGRTIDGPYFKLAVGFGG